MVNRFFAEFVSQSTSPEQRMVNRFFAEFVSINQSRAKNG